MIKPAFSTVACPEWTLGEVVTHAARYGFEAVELRTFGERSTRLACDPAMTSEEKTRSMFHEAGIEILSLGTSLTFEEPISPPVLGNAIGDTERTVRAAKRALDMAVALECPFVRVFVFDIPPRESRKAALARITKRLSIVADAAQKTGVRIVIENAGGFPSARDLVEIIAATRSPLVGACYALAAGVSAGDDPVSAVNEMGDRLWVARIKDLDKKGHPCALGQGTLHCRDFVGSLSRTGFDGPLVFEWDRLWLPGLDAADVVLPAASKQLFHWMGEFAGGSTGAPGAPGSARQSASKR